MSTGIQSQENGTLNLKKQLALAVRSIQWSYAIFWSISATQPGVLEWNDGYYNGDIKTRKTTQAIQLNSDQMGLQRSEQLRELYESLSDGEANSQARRPLASLSPEDLADAEWYYLVCMSFVFNIGEGLPGRTLAKAQPIWLCNAQFADSKVFSRSLLAKSASIQTVVCFPFLGGVIELGTTDRIREDSGFIQHVKSSYLEISHPTASQNNPSVGNTRNNKTFACVGLDQDLLNTKLICVKDLDMVSPDNISNGWEPVHIDDDSFMVEGRNGGAASRIESWKFVDEELSNCVLDSMDSSDCISQNLLNQEKVVSCTKFNHPLRNLQEFNQPKLTSLEPQSDELHYQGVLSVLLKSSRQLVLRSNHHNCHQESSFVNWKKRGFEKSIKPRNGFAQEMLKKVLFDVPKMHIGCMVELPENDANKDGVWRPEAEGVAMNHALSEKKRREKLSKRFSILRSLVPSVSKDDKVSILDDTIEYLKELERRVENLESAPTLLKRKPQDIKEGTSDNYGNKKVGDGKKTLVNKRKACDIDEKEPDNNAAENYISVSVKKNKDVSIEIRCGWRDRVLLDIIDVLSNINLDSHSVQSSTMDGILSLTIKSKLRGSAVASARIIKKALKKIV